MKRTKKSVPPPKLSLPILQILAFEIHSLAFVYMPNLPFKFHRDFTAIKTGHSLLQWCFITISSVHLLFHGLLSCLLALYFGIFGRSEKNLDGNDLLF